MYLTFCYVKKFLDHNSVILFEDQDYKDVHGRQGQIEITEMNRCSRKKY